MANKGRNLAILGGVLAAGYGSYRMFCPSAMQSSSKSVSMSSINNTTNRADNPNVYFDVDIGGQRAGRITMEVEISIIFFIGICRIYQIIYAVAI